jgi:hypothetical protein
VNKLTAENAQLKVSAASASSLPGGPAALESVQRQLQALEKEKKIIEMQLESERQERGREISQSSNDLAAAQEELTVVQVCQPSCALHT